MTLLLLFQTLLFLFFFFSFLLPFILSLFLPILIRRVPLVPKKKRNRAQVTRSALTHPRTGAVLFRSDDAPSEDGRQREETRKGPAPGSQCGPTELEGGSKLRIARPVAEKRFLEAPLGEAAQVDSASGANEYCLGSNHEWFLTCQSIRYAGFLHFADISFLLERRVDGSEYMPSCFDESVSVSPASPPSSPVPLGESSVHSRQLLLGLRPSSALAAPARARRRQQGQPNNVALDGSPPPASLGCVFPEVSSSLLSSPSPHHSPAVSSSSSSYRPCLRVELDSLKFRLRLLQDPFGAALAFGSSPLSFRLWSAARKRGHDEVLKFSFLCRELWELAIKRLLFLGISPGCAFPQPPTQTLLQNSKSRWLYARLTLFCRRLFKRLPLFPSALWHATWLVSSHTGERASTEAGVSALGDEAESRMAKCLDEDFKKKRSSSHGLHGEDKAQSGRKHSNVQPSRRLLLECGSVALFMMVDFLLDDRADLLSHCTFPRPPGRGKNAATETSSKCSGEYGNRSKSKRDSWNALGGSGRGCCSGASHGRLRRAPADHVSSSCCGPGSRVVTRSDRRGDEADAHSDAGATGPTHQHEHEGETCGDGCGEQRERAGNPGTKSPRSLLISLPTSSEGVSSQTAEQNQFAPVEQGASDDKDIGSSILPSRTSPSRLCPSAREHGLPLQSLDVIVGTGISAVRSTEGTVSGFPTRPRSPAASLGRLVGDPTAETARGRFTEDVEERSRDRARVPADAKRRGPDPFLKCEPLRSRDAGLHVLASPRGPRGDLSVGCLRLSGRVPSRGGESRERHRSEAGTREGKLAAQQGGDEVGELGGGAPGGKAGTFTRECLPCSSVPTQTCTSFRFRGRVSSQSRESSLSVLSSPNSVPSIGDLSPGAGTSSSSSSSSVFFSSCCSSWSSPPARYSLFQSVVLLCAVHLVARSCAFHVSRLHIGFLVAAPSTLAENDASKRNDRKQPGGVQKQQRRNPQSAFAVESPAASLVPSTACPSSSSACVLIRTEDLLVLPQAQFAALFVDVRAQKGLSLQALHPSDDLRRILPTDATYCTNPFSSLLLSAGWRNAALHGSPPPRFACAVSIVVIVIVW